MSRKKQTDNTPVDTGRGCIKDNYLAALVTSKVYKMQVVKAKKGKGSFKRQDKFQGKGTEPYLIAA
ncbi:MAG: alternative ribosome-rescue factor [Alteromonadaceae bacterium]|jgi:alternative ribosome-rescue factor